MPTADVYVRISDDREGAGLGVARQEQDCRELAQRLGLDIAAVHVDNDLSAYSGKPRPAYLQLLDRIRGGHVGTVLAWHTDRLHRSPVELEDYIAACETGPTPTVTVKAGALDLSTPSGRMVARMLGSAARYESEHKAERQRAKHLELARAGKPSGGLRPFGYQADRVTVDEAEAAVVSEVAARILAGESLRGVAADLNRRGVPTVTGRRWADTVIRSMLLRPRLAGLREHRGTTYDAVWPAILTMDTHLALTALLTSPDRQRRTVYAGRVHLLAGILRCAVDDSRLVSICGAASRPVNSRFAYRCPACGQSASAGPVEDLVVERGVLPRLSDPRLVAAVTDAGPDVAAAQLVLTTGQARLEEIGRDGAASGLPLVTLRSMTAEVEARMAEARATLGAAALAAHAAPLPVVEDREEWDALPLATRRATVSAVLPDLRLRRPSRPARTFESDRVMLG